MNLFDVMPALTLDDAEDGLMADAILVCQGRASVGRRVLDVGISDLLNSLFSQLSQVLSFAFHLTIFCLSVGDVFYVGSEKQVTWPDTTGIVTMVKNTKAVWDSLKVEFPGKPVSKHALTVYRVPAVTTDVAGGPDPASRLENRMERAEPVDLAPEPFGRRQLDWIVDGPESLPPHVVCPAPTTGHERSMATFNGTRKKMIGATRHDATPLVGPKS